MKRLNRILIGVVCTVLLAVSWVIAVSAKSIPSRQLELIAQADALICDGIFIRAVPFLEEAAGYDAKHTLTAEAKLKEVYVALKNTPGFRRKYIDLLDKQMDRKDSSPDVYYEAASYYLNVSKTADALTVLKNGIEKTGAGQLITLYEDVRYAFKYNRTSYDHVTAISGIAAQVLRNGLWGVVMSDGTSMIPCEYEKISTFSGNRCIAQKDGEIFAVDSNNNRIAKLSIAADDFGNLSEDRIPLKLNGGWQRSNGEFVLGSTVFEQLGMYSSGAVAAKSGGMWGVVDIGTTWLIAAEYDEIILDELGRCYAQNAAFARKGTSVYLIAGGERLSGIYEDAHPFSDEGYAAVKLDGKWGFIDTSGNTVIDFIYDDALSFGQHLAAVKLGEQWGYISKYGKIVIEPIFSEAKSFSCGSAPVLTSRGWQFITLIEFMKGASI